jgi:hypothetical protein
MKRQLIAAAATVIAISSAAFIPAPAMAQAAVDIMAFNAPPPQRYERVPRARRDFVWAPGHWNWNGRRYIWIAGHWERVRHGHQYRNPEWRQGPNGWHLDRGGWYR